jgi:hypothetical protein
MTIIEGKGRREGREGKGREGKIVDQLFLETSLL